MKYISKDSLKLLEYFFDIELEKFIQGETIGTACKYARLNECKEEIIIFIESHPNSIFLINNTEDKKSTMSLVIENIEEKNDHLKEYTITISESCETFKVTRQLGCVDSEIRKNIQIIKEFEKSRL
jgi:hypothetical protein